MINLDQVRTLEWKVKQAVQLIGHLRKENDTLRSRLSDTEVRLQELESSLETFKATQSEMESGIRSALEELDHLDSAPAVSGPVDQAAPAAAPVAEAVSFPPVAEPVPDEAAPQVAEVPEDDFDAEFARLEAEEAAQSEPVEVPESVELESEPSPEETGLFDEPAAAPPAAEDRKPEQPGLGIF